MTRRVVYDCMVFLQAATNAEGPAGKCVQLAELGRVELCISNAILAEVRNVLTRPKTLKKFPRLQAVDVDDFLRRAIRYATGIHDAPKVVSLPRDPKDEKYLDLAIAAGAGLLVSRDNDLLELMDDQMFRTSHPALTIIDPVTLLHTLAADATNG